MKNKSRRFFLGLLSGIAVTLMLLLLVGIINRQMDLSDWFKLAPSTLADWAGTFGTLAAFVAVIWQQERQENAARAIKVEESRPRFSVAFSPEVEIETTLLFWKRQPEEVIDLVNNFNADNYRWITIENISKNVVYNFKVALQYHTKNDELPRIDYWTTSGIFPRQKIVPIPKFKDTKLDRLGEVTYDALFVEFTTPANEVGFFEMTNVNQANTDTALGNDQYYFVSDSYIKGVTAVNQDEMLKSTSKKWRQLKEIFHDSVGPTNFLQKHHDGKIY